MANAGPNRAPANRQPPSQPPFPALNGLLTLPIAARSMQLLMEEGDCYILVGSMAHAGTRNDIGTESRKSLIFRLLSEAHNPGGPKVDRPGLSDHPVRLTPPRCSFGTIRFAQTCVPQHGAGFCI